MTYYLSVYFIYLFLSDPGCILEKGSGLEFEPLNHVLKRGVGVRACSQCCGGKDSCSILEKGRSSSKTSPKLHKPPPTQHTPPILVFSSHRPTGRAPVLALPRGADKHPHFHQYPCLIKCLCSDLPI